MIKYAMISVPILMLANLALAQNSTSNGGIIIGRDNKNSPITINLDLNTLACRHPIHGVERYQRSFSVTRTSGEMGGGHDETEWCNAVKGALAGEFPGGQFTVIGSRSGSKNHCKPFNCPQYTYVCTVKVEADPVYKIAVGPECH